MDDELDTPNCPRCLVRLGVSDDGPVVWRCPECGLVKVV